MDSATARPVVFITAWNCESYISRAINSLCDQTFQDFDILVVDDVSTDGTREVAREILRDRFPSRSRLVVNAERIGRAANAFIHLNGVNASFVALLDGDDAIVDPRVLERFADAYRAGYDVVWSNYRTSDGRIGHCRPLDPLRDPRSQGWNTSHLFSFRLDLFKNIPEHYFKHPDGTWIRSACDRVVAYPLLDQTRRYKFIDTIAYEYTIDNPLSLHNVDGMTQRLSSPEQEKNASYVASKEPMLLVNQLETADIPFREFRLGATESWASWAL